MADNERGAVALRAAVVVGVAALAGLALAAARPEPPEFERWLADLRAEALEASISATILDAALADVQPIERVIELDRNQPESKLTFARYLEIVVPDQRVERGRQEMRRHRAVLEELARKYGVQARFIVALWGVESDFGRQTGGFQVIDALATLAWDGRRGEFFRGELMDALRILDEGHVAPDAMIGSWAGAMGQPQFMPSTFRQYAVDFDGDDRRDIWDTTEDALASAANYLSRSGWRDDQTWGRAVRVPDGFDPGLVGLKVKKRLSQWQALGVRRDDGSDLPTRDLPGSLVQPDGSTGPTFVVYDNYRTILRWNRSNYFASAVGLFSDRLR